ncbi:MAG: NUDIX hydrolase [Deltaproteobacteria bacterium RIFOXYD12_FULL_57_12]|nr:MAG: NUDIX hydrolase [Deltaproteobacteria bacterium RIFOXYD12_FULL_57_12]
MGSENEVVTVVDARDVEIGAVPRQEMRRRRLIHRAAYVLVFNSAGEFFVQQRTRTKDIYPGYYDIAAGGVVLAGESYLEAARRELAEELGIRDIALRELFYFYYEDAANRVWGMAYSCCHDGAMILQPEEVEGGEFLSLARIRSMARTEPFTPDGLVLLERYCREQAAISGSP